MDGWMDGRARPDLQRSAKSPRGGIFCGRADRGRTLLYPGRWPCKADGHIFKQRARIKEASLSSCLLLPLVICACWKYESFWAEAVAEGGVGGGGVTHFFLSTVTRKVTVGVSSHLLSSAFVNWKMEVEMMDNHRSWYIYIFFLIHAPQLRAGRVQSP